MDTLVPTVSVVLAVYNGARYVRQCLDSIFAQTYRDFEVIVIDDGSTDDTASICRSYDAVLLQQANAGPAAARNYGVSRSSGRYIALVDHDDWWYPHRLERGVEVLEARPEVALAYSDLDHIDAEDNVIERAYYARMGGHPRQSLAQCLAGGMHVSPSTVLMRKSTFEALGGFDPRLRSSEDDDLFIRVMASERLHYIDEPLAQWRSHATQLSRGRRYPESSRIFMHNLLNRFPDRPEADEYLARDVIVPRFLGYFLSAYAWALSSSTPHAEGEDDRHELRFLLGRSVQRRPLLRLFLLMPYWVARPAYRLAMKLPLPGTVKRPIEGLLVSQPASQA